MAYVRKKRINGSEYYYLVEGYRDEDGKVRQRVIKYLGKHVSIEDAKAAAADVVPNYIEELKEISAVYAQNLKASVRNYKESSGIYGRLEELRGQRSKAATTERKRLRERQAELSVCHDRYKAAYHHAAEVYDGLAPSEQKLVQNLVEKSPAEFAVMANILANRRMDVYASGRSAR